MLPTVVDYTTLWAYWPMFASRIPCVYAIEGSDLTVSAMIFLSVSADNSPKRAKDKELKSEEAVSGT